MNQIIKTTVAEIGGEERNYEGLVTFHNDDPVTTSLRFAEIFGECHDHVLQVINGLKELEFHRLYFKPVIYSQGEGKSFKIYLISMDGFLVLSTAFPNKKTQYDIYYEAFRAARKSRNPSAGQILCTVIDIFGAERIIEQLKKCRHLEQEIEHGKNAHD